MRLSLIVAMSRGRIIGRSGDLPWHLPADLARFKRLTMGHHLIVGRRTWESIGRPLPGRRMIVVSRNRRLELPEEVLRAGSLDEALEMAEASADEEVFIGGGASLYGEALERIDRLYLTEIDAAVEGDTQFPPWDRTRWVLLSREERHRDADNPHPLRFLVYERRDGARA